MPLSDLGDVEALLRRFKKAAEYRELARSLHQDAYDFAAPQRETFRFHSPGQEKNNHVYDSTAIRALEQFASRIKGSTLPSWKHWMTLTSGTVVPESEKAGIDKQLEKISEVFFNELNHSNFDTECNSSLVDLGIGTGAIIIDENPDLIGDAFKFTSVPMSELYPEKPAEGRIRSVWRKQKLQVGAIEQIWPGAKLPQKLKEKAEKDPFTEDDFLNGQLYNPKDKKYYQVVIYEPSKDIIFDQSFDSQRFIVFRWHVIAGEVFGRGPAIQSLPDIRTLNKVVQFDLEAAALSIGGVYTGINDGIFNPNTVRIAPKTIIPVGSNNNQNPTLRALERAGDPTVAQIQMERLQDAINKAFFANPLGDISDPVRSATENMIRQQEMLKQAGASFGRIRSELVEPLVEAGLDILMSRGQIERFRVDGEQATIRHTSPLAKTEDLEDFQNAQIWLQFNQAVLGEGMAGAIKIEDLAKFSQEKLGIPADLVRTEAERQQFGEQALAAAQQMGVTPQDVA